MGVRLLHRLAVLAVGTGALLLAAPGVALADSVSVSPGTVKAGDRITVHVVCKGAGSESAKIFWGKDANHPQETKEVKLRGGAASATFRIPRDTAPGRYLAGAFCPGAGKAVTAQFTVAPHGAPQAGVGPGGTGGVLVAGAAVLAAAAAGGLLLKRRGAPAR